MKKEQKAAMLEEWLTVLKSHPRFAKVFLAQQAILIEASEMGCRQIDARMSKLTQLGAIVPFHDYWENKQPPRCEDLNGILGCIAKAKDPSSCFSIPQEDAWEWFDDPLADGKPWPPQDFPVPPY